VGEDQKLPLLLGLLQREEWERVLIFVNTKVGVEWLTQKLKGNGLPAEMITGDLPQKKRFQLMDRYKSGKIKILVATDVASRGIHVEDISHVINYDLPQDAENYVHRIGRTARAGKQGKAISMACERYVLHLEPVETMLGYKIPVIWAEDDWYAEDKAGSVRVASRTRDKRNGRGKPPRGGEGRKNGSAGPRVREKPVGEDQGEAGKRSGPRVREKPQPKPVPKRPPGYFPGTFFGFAPPETTRQPENETAAAEPPPVPEDAPAPESETPPAAPPAEATPPAAAATPGESPKPKKRRRRPRRRRKKPEEGAAGAPEAAAETPPAEVPPAD
jgi:ATP-dependent RNA helicase RhlB